MNKWMNDWINEWVDERKVLHVGYIDQIYFTQV